jgi:hypothetical protein
VLQSVGLFSEGIRLVLNYTESADDNEPILADESRIVEIPSLF